MAISITVYPYLSPRIVVVDYPQAEATVQEIVNAIRAWEDDEPQAAITFPSLIDAAGKEELGGGVTVGITATLQNAQLRFAARPTALSTGTATSNDTTGQTLTDSGADFVSDGVYAGCTAINTTTYAMETVIGVTTNTLTTFALQNGTRQDWQIGDSYRIYPNELCQITGGNLVAIDDLGASIDPLLQAPNINVVRSSSSSATLQELEDIQHSSFGGAINIDAVNGTAGTDYPQGNIQNPIDNLADALAVNNIRKFDKLRIHGSFTFQATDNIDGLTICGEGQEYTTLTLASGVSTSGALFCAATITGTQGGETHYENCEIDALSGTHCKFTRCRLNGPLTMHASASDTTILEDCYSGTPNHTPVVVDHNDGQVDMLFRNYAGGVKFQNITQAVEIDVDLNSGYIITEASCTAGNINARGVGLVTDGGGGTTFDQSGLISTESVAKTILDAVYIDTIAGEAGTTFPIGTAARPVDNIADAYTIAQTLNLHEYRIRGTITLDRAYTSWTFTGVTTNTEDTVNLNGQDVSRSLFTLLKVAGQQGTGTETTEYRNCTIYEVTNASGFIHNGTIINSIGLGPSGTSIYMVDTSAGGSAGVTIDCVGAGRIIGAINMSGEWTITNVVDGAPFPTVGLLTFSSGKLAIDATCTGGSIEVLGNSLVTNNGTGTYTNHTTAAGVWDEALADHTTGGSFGEKISLLQDASIVATTAAQVGSTSTSILTTLTQANDFFNGMMVMAKNSSGLAVRKIDQYNNTNGELMLDSALPFTPSVDDTIQILTARSTGRTGLN